MAGFYRFILSVLIVFSVASAEAQIDPLYAQYLNNPLTINPAYTGLNKELSISVSGRSQWSGFEGSPKTVNLSAHTSLLDNRMGAGLIVVKDVIGEYNNTLAMGAYSYKIQLDRNYISFGLQAGVVNYRADNSALNILHPDDPYFSENVNVTKPVFGAGMIFTNDNLFLGLSVPRMLKTKDKFTYTDPDTNDTESVENDIYSQHFYAMGSYILFINERLRLKPAVLVKYVQANPLSVDLNAVLNIDERYGVGAFTRNFGTYGLLLQAKFGQVFRLGYAFEVPTGKSVGVNFTTHELTLGLSIAAFDFHDIARVNSF